VSASGRRDAILAELEQGSAVDTAQLARRFAVSGMTIRRDLAALEAQGRLRRARGGAVAAHITGAEPRYAAKQLANAGLKSRIARYAVDNLVEDGDILLLEGGTTVTSMVRYLRGKRDLTVVTNGLYTACELGLLLPEVTVLTVGGLLREASFTTVGPTAEAFFDAFHGDKLFISATGLTLEAGFTDPNPLEAAVRGRMREAAGQVIALMDSTKFGVTSLVQTAPPEGVSALVTDPGAPADAVDALRRLGVDVRIA
jgi:DeoR/GlpR family transcriptional regulator of sugar metabolism